MSVCDVTWIDLPHAPDERGILVSIESGLDVPFPIERVYFMYDVRAERGGHAHRETRQVLIPLAGRFLVDVTDGSNSETYTLAEPHRGLYLPAMTWSRLYDFEPGAVCLVVADTHFSEHGYIRDWAEFVTLVRGASPGS